MAAGLPQSQQQISQPSIPQQQPIPQMQASTVQPQNQMNSMPVMQQTPVNPAHSNPSQNAMNTLPQALSGEQAAPPSAPNMFKLQRGRSKKFL